MEEQINYDDSLQPPKNEMRLSGKDKYLLVSSAKWAKFISIVMFVYLGLGIVSLLFMMLAVGVAGFSMHDMYGGMHNPFSVIFSKILWPVMILYLCVYIVLLLPSFHLYRFAQKAKVALAAGDETVMTESFHNLRSSIKIIGIIVIVTLSICILSLIVTAITALTL